MAGAREGSLEAPTRHALDWKNPDFYDEDKLLHELERVFDICHGCRRCVSLCDSFPTLFDLVDESDTFEVDGVERTAKLSCMIDIGRVRERVERLLPDARVAVGHGQMKETELERIMLDFVAGRFDPLNPLLRKIGVPHSFLPECLELPLVPRDELGPFVR